MHFVSDGQIINSKISAVEKFQFGISLGLAKYYSDAVSDNVKRAIEQKVRKGELPGRAPYGYKNIVRPDGAKDIIKDEHASHIVSKAFELYATGLYSMHLLRAKLKEDYGVDWSKSYIDKVLRNPFFHGYMLIKGNAYPHRYEPIITKDLFEEVQQIKAGFNKKKVKYATIPFIYRGMFRCAQCGLAITAEKHKGRLVYYHCTEYKGKHGAVWLKEEEITEQISDVFKRLQMPASIQKKIVETLDSTHQNKVDFRNQQFDKLTAEQKMVTKMIDNLYMDKLRGKISDEQYDKFYETLRLQADDITRRLSKLQEADDNYYVTARYILELTNHAYDAFMNSEVDEKRQLIGLILSNLMIDDGKIVYDVHKPFNLVLNCSDEQVWRARE